MRIPTHLILGFLGAGKTTAILDLLQRKPANETWAVLVNEFGEVGIDGALLASQGAVVREVPGGCMCCVAGLPMQMGLNMLIRQAQPDRLLIEPTGLGHPAQILETLGGEFYRDVLALQANICLVDPRRLEDPRVIGNLHFQDQVAAGDVLVANKTDLCSAEQVAAFWTWAEALEPPKRHLAQTHHGRLDPAWLEGSAGVPSFVAADAHAHRHDHSHTALAPHNPAVTGNRPWQHWANQGDGYYSLGWVIEPETRFETTRLYALLAQSRLARAKGVLRTEQGWLALNAVDGVLERYPISPQAANRLELIADGMLDAACFDMQLRDSVGSAGHGSLG
ncbi:GTP-binding protein [Marinobacter nanhaiticus D15-8W]|uniref:GTP-binding protein n=1 Tax=Marinobacter nanhaiticus D15-8W TaxID=626887 RepID=N6VXR9_9GAMM|nr:GTP-binding protein [Marinobacter nanhaiticus]ENO15075.1 GTP-binding protein [Marinobacter nanhaiticus D15-8W]BES69227.1 GTP-binding protein [Marinobacter nanhaiticus D15-8W]